MRGSGSSKSVWMEENLPEALLSRPPAKADVCIVGAGMAGITTAYNCVQEGLTPVVIDRGPPASGETARTTAHLTNAIDDRIYEMERLFGARGAKLAVGGHTSAIDTIESNVKREKISCNFTRLDGYLFLQEGDKPKTLEKELAAARRAGLAGVEMVERAPIDGFDTGAALRFPNQAQFHPLKYLRGLIKAISSETGPFLHHGLAKDVDDGSTCKVVLADGKKIAANSVVVTTNAPFTSRVAIHNKQAPYRTYVIGARVPAGSVTKALFWDSLSPYHYVRTEPEPGSRKYETLVVGGEDHRTGLKDDAPLRWSSLKDWAKERFPMIEETNYEWSGQVMETLDGLGYLGKHPMMKNVYVITGDSGMGMTHTTLGAQIVVDEILSRSNPYAKLFAPNRKNAKAPLEYAKEVVKMSTGWLRLLKKGDFGGVEEIPINQGGIVNQGAKKIAVYRDEFGRVSACSAICTHAGCTVSWNSTETTWDCACHGSRFDPQGKVLNGPAPADLEPVKIPHPKSDATYGGRRRPSRRRDSRRRAVTKEEKG